MPARKSTGAAGKRPACPPSGDPAALADAIAALRAGELIVYPTETFYALGGDPFSPAALERLFAAKGRAETKTVALIAADSHSALELAREVSPIARRLAQRFWPGALTLVLPARADLPAAIVGAGGGVGVRVSAHRVARALAAGVGHPITATSANQAGAAPARTLDEARAAFGGKVKVFLEGGALDAAAPSTVVAIEDETWRIIRAGAIGKTQLVAALRAEVLK
ncbi:MAG TPA: L-threonylcarbamoyladenylate synthase [Candidatus Binataceae bacterium]|nr:L-threonylcarbamoyladenylate synthase [Candidatus Binataceae bacterium]